MALHLPKRWYAVSSSSSHLGYNGSVRIFITVKCLLRATWPVSKPVMIRKCFLLRPMAKHVSHLLGPCLQPTVDCQRLRWILWHHLETKFGDSCTPMNRDLIKSTLPSCISSHAKHSSKQSWSYLSKWLLGDQNAKKSSSVHSYISNMWVKVGKYPHILKNIK